MKKQKILLIDDSEIVLVTARKALEEKGFEVITAMRAIDANKYVFCQDQPDLIILDVMLPMLDGDRKAKMLKDNELSRDIPILLISSKPEPELQRLVTQCGADGFIRKPFADEQIVAKVQDTLRKKG